MHAGPGRVCDHHVGLLSNLLESRFDVPPNELTMMDLVCLAVFLCISDSAFRDFNACDLLSPFGKEDGDGSCSAVQVYHRFLSCEFCIAFHDPIKTLSASRVGLEEGIG